MKKVILVILLITISNTAFSQLNGEISSITKANGHPWGKNETVKRDSIYIINFTGDSIRDMHIRIHDTLATVSYNKGAMPVPPSNNNIDTQVGAFSDGSTWIGPNRERYMSFFKSGGALSQGSIQIRFNSGTLWYTEDVFFTSDGDEILDNGDSVKITSGEYGITLCSIDPNGASCMYASDSIIYVTAVGNVGIGTWNPLNMIDISGNAVIGTTYSGIFTAPENGLLVEGPVSLGNPLYESSAAFEVSSTTQGVLLPRMTRVERNAINAPAEGLMVYCTTCGTHGSLSLYSNGSWLTFTPCMVASPMEGYHETSPGVITWNWYPAAGADGYKWNTLPDYESAIDVETNHSYTETAIVCDCTYTRYIWAYNSCGESAMATLTQAVEAEAPSTLVEGTHYAEASIIMWVWHPLENDDSLVTGIYWSFINDINSAVFLGMSTSYYEQNLTCGTSYTRYAWAANGCGYSEPLVMSATTLDCFSCGTNLTIEHLTSGGVAPVDKTVTYGTITNVPGEPYKCWITKNLGASQQPSDALDTTEASAGWYWQFNRQQGYKFSDQRTPNTTWVFPISEVFDWQVSYDPCRLELGNQWRLPASYEWYNVSGGGGWMSVYDGYNLELTLHAAGNLTHDGGVLENRGTDGTYWSVSDDGYGDGISLYLTTSFSGTSSKSKSTGCSVRCIKD